MHHSGGLYSGGGGGVGPQERVHQVQQQQQNQPADKCSYQSYPGQIPDCCAAAVAIQDGRCYDECLIQPSYQDENYPQVSSSSSLYVALKTNTRRERRFVILLLHSEAYNYSVCVSSTAAAVINERDILVK